ncbi:hypothetical protein ACIBUR_10065 [Streptomyces anulatus]
MSEIPDVRLVPVTRAQQEAISEVLEALARESHRLEEAAEGDSNDAEIQAGHDLAAEADRLVKLLYSLQLDAAPGPTDEGNRMYTVFGVQSDFSGERFVSAILDGAFPLPDNTFEAADDFTSRVALVSAPSTEAAAAEFRTMNQEDDE